MIVGTDFVGKSPQAVSGNNPPHRAVSNKCQPCLARGLTIAVDRVCRQQFWLKVGCYFNWALRSEAELTGVWQV